MRLRHAAWLLLVLAGCATHRATPGPYGPLACVPPPPRADPAAACHTPEQILAVVNAHRDDVERCVQASRAADPDAPRRTVRMTWDILPDGKPAKVGYVDCGDPVFGECLSAALAAWTFPACATGTPAIVFPFAF